MTVPREDVKVSFETQRSFRRWYGEHRVVSVCGVFGNSKQTQGIMANGKKRKGLR